ncbi:MAG: LD-carboxypeptidase [Verrucomicrobia bacterium]|nr:LD-carboxypeptidase [Verrucomicrobiota bacterium]
MPLKPARLLSGDTIGVVSPASPPADARNIDRAVAALEALGYRVKLMPRARQRHGFLAGSDRDRAGDLMRAFTDHKVKAILCVRGGHGVTRILPRLDFAAIRRNPKIFVGYSDLTALHCALRSHANLISFHGPMLNADFVTHRFPKFIRESFLRTLTQPSAPGGICTGYQGKTVSVLRGGTATGELIGGNLTMLCALLGTPWQPSFRRKILFFEDVNEPPYRFDRLLTQLLNAGLLQQVAGIAIGLNADCVDRTARRGGEFRQTLADVFRERLLPLRVPVVAGLPFGHVAANATLPVGLRVTLDGRAGDLVIPTGAVR